jgi:hypothetical protein
MVDMVVDRRQLRDSIIRSLNFMMNSKLSAAGS